MDFKKQLPMAFGVLALAAVEFGVPAQAAKVRCASEECACEQALRQNTVEALEEFLRKYPQNANSKASACMALAVPPADDGVDNQDGDGQASQPDVEGAAPDFGTAQSLQGETVR